MLVRSVNEKESTSRPTLKPRLQGRLNSFQMTMLDWNDLHPYNAVHVVRIPGTLQLTKLQQDLRNVLEFHGLAGLMLNRKRGTFQYTGGPVRAELKALAVAENPLEALRAEIETQVNTGFPITDSFEPFRFFVVPEKASFLLGLVYFHAVADAISIVHLLRQIYTAHLGGGLAPGVKPFELARPESKFEPVALARKLAGFGTQLRQHRRSVRVAHQNIFDARNRFEQLTLGPESLRALAAAAKSWDVTINDIFLSALLLCCAPFTLNRFQEPPRGRISVGCIVNTRADLGLADPPGWGLFLGSFVVSHAVPEGIRLPELAADIRRQTLGHKRRKHYVGPSPELALGRCLLSFFSTAYRTKLYQKHYPLWGGVTNMNLNSIWPQRAGEPPVDYFRGVSTGPVTPLVLSVTTAGDHLNLGLTFRATTFTDAHIRQVKKHLQTLLGQLTPCA